MKQVRQKLMRKLPRNNQQGFTLIELLVVISILGILAAIVTMSMVGITNVATTRAALTEKQSVQIAYDTMLADQKVTANGECVGTVQAAPGTNDMSSAGLVTKAYVKSDGDGSGQPVALYPNYLRQKITHGTYYCTQPGGANTPGGTIEQGSYKP